MKEHILFAILLGWYVLMAGGAVVAAAVVLFSHWGVIFLYALVFGALLSYAVGRFMLAAVDR